MDTNLQIFNHPDFGDIRAVEINGEPWLVGKDVAIALGYSNPRDALAKHVDSDDKGVSRIATPSGEQTMTVINESGLYSLILSSKLPSAKQFKRWVTSEVLPSIRKHGGYIAGQEEMTDEELLARALLMADSKIKEKDALIAKQEEQIREMLPAKVFSDAVTASDDSCLVSDVAKMLRQNGVDVGQNRLFGWLRKNGYLIRRGGSSHNMPTQKSVERGLLQINQSVQMNGDKTVVRRTPVVTGKGQKYFINRYLSDVMNENQISMDLGD